MTRRSRWILALLAVLLLAGMGGRWLMLRKQAAASAQALPASAAAALPLELAASDVATAQRAELIGQLAVSGGLKAVNSAVVKARVAAELLQLSVREGDRVQAGQLIGRLDDTEARLRLKQAEDQAANAKAQLEIALRTRSNNQALVDQGFISKTALDTAVSSADGASASLQAARAAADIARKAVQDCEIRAPLSGLVAQRLAQPGERMSLDARIVDIVDLSRIELEAAVSPEDVIAVRVGQTAQVQIDGLAEPVPARVVRINPGTQSGTRAVMTYLQLQSLPGLRQGLFARGQIELQRKTALVVPASALRYDQARPYVLLLAGGRAALRPVQLGVRGEVVFGGRSEAAVEVLSGVAEGDTVLRGSVGALRDGTPLKLAAAAAAPAAR
jgi:membrane fusion protein, multidrug efflux system